MVSPWHQGVPPPLTETKGRTMEVQPSGSDLSINEYGERHNVHHRTVRRWLADGKLPGATKDPFTGAWRIPADAQPVQMSTDVAPLQMTGGEQGMVLPQGWSMAPEEQVPTRLDELADEPAFLTVADAAQYLGIPQAQILANPELFEVMHVGVSGAPRVPKRTVYAFEGGGR